MPTKFQQETLKPRFVQAKVLVVGDVMLDRYWFGDVSRISPEAPVPVAKIEKTEHRAGGAANVARNVAALGGQAVLLSVIGNDETGDCLNALMAEHGVETVLIRDQNIATTVKLRVVARNQQLIRLDFEDAPTHEVLDGVKNRFRELLAECDVVILSDYGKGGLTHVVSFIEWARQAGKPVLIDPKGDDYAKYTGATLLTPNLAELRQVTGSWKNEADLQEKARADAEAELRNKIAAEEQAETQTAPEPQTEPTPGEPVLEYIITIKMNTTLTNAKAVATNLKNSPRADIKLCRGA